VDRAVAIFDAHAGEYDDALRRRIVPCFDVFYGTAAGLVGLRGPVRRVLDLGAGTGLLSGAILSAHPQAHVVLLDGAAEMLGRAEQRLPQGSITTVVGDLRDELPDGPFDAVVSALAIHHLEDRAKQDLFRRALGLLRPAGVFVNAEQVAGPTPWHSELYRESWRRECRGAGASEAEIAAAETRMLADRASTLSDQLEWLTTAGFSGADCFFRQSHFAVFAAWAAG
jgi:tRNA (cmo5U34)-methyltransferase